MGSVTVAVSVMPIPSDHFVTAADNSKQSPQPPVVIENEEPPVTLASPINPCALAKL